MRDPQAVIGTEQLAGSLRQPDLRIYDCTTYLEPTPAGSDDPYIAVSGRRTFEEAHIPGADFLDLQGEFSDATTRLRFMMPPTAQLEAAFGRHGLGEGSRVVLYSIGSMMWATRFWWMLQVARLRRRGRARRRVRQMEGGGPAHRERPCQGLPAGDVQGQAAPGLVRRQGAPCWPRSEIASTVIVNALGPQFHKGLEPSRYGRPGAHPRQRQRPGREPRGSRDKGLHDAGGRRGEVHGAAA